MATKPKALTTKKPGTGKAASPRMSLAEVMSALEKAGTEQARKTYRRHGAADPMFGVSFADLKILVKRIKVDHELARGLWDTGNFDARNLALKIADPLLMSVKDLDLWANAEMAQMCETYLAQLAAEGPHGRSRAEAWLASKVDALRCVGWLLVGALTYQDEGIPSSWFLAHIATIEKRIHNAPNEERKAMNGALISIGCRDAAARKASVAAAKRIGIVTVDHGATGCKTPSAPEYIEKAWAASSSKGFESPAAQERNREPMRTRC